MSDENNPKGVRIPPLMEIVPDQKPDAWNPLSPYPPAEPTQGQPIPAHLDPRVIGETPPKPAKERKPGYTGRLDDFSRRLDIFDDRERGSKLELEELWGIVKGTRKDVANVVKAVDDTNRKLDGVAAGNTGLYPEVTDLRRAVTTNITRLDGEIRAVKVWVLVAFALVIFELVWALARHWQETWDFFQAFGP